MRLHESYLLSLGASFALATFALALFNEVQLSLYVSVYIVEYFIVTLLHPALKPKSSRALDLIGYVLFAVFAVIVALNVWSILFGTLSI